MRNPVMNCIHIIVDGFTHGFHAVPHEYLAIQQLGFVDTGRRFNFFDKRCGLLMRNEL